MKKITCLAVCFVFLFSFSLPAQWGPPWKITAVSPDGNKIVTFFDDVTRIWNVNSGKELRTVKLPIEEPCFSDFSPDGTKFFTISDRENVSIFDVDSGEKLLTWKSPESAVMNTIYSAEKNGIFSPNGKKVVTVTLDDNKASIVRILDANSGKELITLDEGPPRPRFPRLRRSIRQIETGHREYISVYFSQDGKKVFTISGEDDPGAWSSATVQIWNSNSGKRTAIFEVKIGGCECCGHPTYFVSSDEKKFATINEGTVRIWDTDTGRHLKLRHPQVGFLTDFSPDGNNIATVSERNIVRVWSTTSGRLLQRWEWPNGNISDVIFSPDGKRIAALSYSWGETGEDNTIRIWTLP